MKLKSVPLKYLSNVDMGHSIMFLKEHRTQVRSEWVLVSGAPGSDLPFFNEVVGPDT